MLNSKEIKEIREKIKDLQDNTRWIYSKRFRALVNPKMAIEDLSQKVEEQKITTDLILKYLKLEVQTQCEEELPKLIQRRE